jgi:hypothetical protein
MFGREMNKFETWSADKDIDKLIALDKRTAEIQFHFDNTVPDTVKTIGNKQIEQTNIQNNANNVMDKPLEIGTVVYLKNEGLLSKLAPRFKGPFTVVAQAKSNNYKLKDAAKKVLDKTYPLEKLKLTVDHQIDDVYAVERILDDRKYYRRQQYLVKWKNCPDSENSWENESNFVTMLPIKLYWESKKDDSNSVLRRSKRVEKVNLLTVVRPIDPFSFVLFLMKTPTSTRFRDNFRYCEGLSNARIVDVNSAFTDFSAKENKELVPWLPLNTTVPFQVAIMKKITYAISGSAFQCSMSKLTIQTHTNMFFDQSEKISTEPISLSASDCWYMVHTKRCKEKHMLCDGPSCAYKAQIKTTYRWLETIWHEDYSCHFTPLE